MNFTESLRQAFDSLKANKLRSILTMLGIVMGVFSVITIMALGNAAEDYMNSQFEKIGANTISITYKARSVGRQDWLKLEDMETIKKVAPEIKNIATSLQRSGSLRMGSKIRDAVIIGVSSQYKSFDLIEMAYGRFVNDFDIAARIRVIIIDEFFVQKYFKNTTKVIGQSIILKTPSGSSVSVKIIGIKKSGNDLFGTMLNNERIPAMAYKYRTIHLPQ